MTDTNGGFFVHVKNSKPVPFEVAADTSLQSLHWSLVSAPPTAKGVEEGAAGNPLQVVVQMGHPALAQKPENNKIIEPQPDPNAISSSVEPRNPQGSIPVAVQKPAKSVVLEPQVAAETVSASIRPHDLRLAVLIARESASTETNEPRRDADVLTASNKAPDLGIPLHFVIQKSPGVVVYEPARRIDEASANEQAGELQTAVHALRADPPAPPDKPVEQHRPKQSNRILHSIWSYLTAPAQPKGSKS
jgi:hypothetical protein